MTDELKTGPSIEPYDTWHYGYSRRCTVQRLMWVDVG